MRSTRRARQDDQSTAEHGAPMPQQVTRVASDDALTAIYRIAHDEQEDVIAVRLAERLGVAPASVSAMLGRLSRDELVCVDDRKRVSLTPAGVTRARQMIRRHRLAECLLVNVLGLEWWRAYEEAHLLEHAVSDVTEPLIANLVGVPTVSPFGFPIPTADDDGELPPSLRLSDLSDGDSATVQRVYEEDEELLRFFDEHGIRPGAPLDVVKVTPPLGITSLRVDGREVVLGSAAARRIWVGW